MQLYNQTSVIVPIISLGAEIDPGGVLDFDDLAPAGLGDSARAEIAGLIACETLAIKLSETILGRDASIVAFERMDAADSEGLKRVLVFEDLATVGNRRLAEESGGGRLVYLLLTCAAMLNGDAVFRVTCDGVAFDIPFIAAHDAGMLAPGDGPISAARNKNAVTGVLNMAMRFRSSFFIDLLSETEHECGGFAAIEIL